MPEDVCPKCGLNYVGYEVQGVYDGVLYWACPHCGHAWARFTGTDKLSRLSAEYADKHNKSFKEAT